MRRQITYKTLRKGILALLTLAVLLPAFLVARPAPARADCCGCPFFSCSFAATIIVAFHEAGRAAIISTAIREFKAHRTWWADGFYRGYVAPALMRFTEQMSAVAMQQAFIVGSIFDAKHQLETQRLFQEMSFIAHRDYLPTQSYCWFGTNVRSMSASEENAKFNTLTLASRQLGRQLGHKNIQGAAAPDQDRIDRWRSFVSHYCDPKDNNWTARYPGSGLVLACGAGAPDARRKNLDIDYTRLMEEPRTIDVALGSTIGAAALADLPAGTQDILALASNLYGHNAARHNLAPETLLTSQGQHNYMQLRAVTAKRAVAESSFLSIAGLKSSGTSQGTGPDSGTQGFMAAILRDMGVPEGEVFQIIGQNPSYYAQLEVLSKKIYQNPDFYAELYDKPANIKRKDVAMKGIGLMLDRAMFESDMRQEMALSVLLSASMRDIFKSVQRDLPSRAPADQPGGAP